MPSQKTVEEHRQALIAECDYFAFEWLAQRLRGEISPYDLRPADRAIREAEMNGPEDLIDVHKVDTTSLPSTDLQLPLLFQPKTQPAVAGALGDFCGRLDQFSG